MKRLLKQSTAVTKIVGPFLDVIDGNTPETGVAAGSVDTIGVFKEGATSITDISGTTTLTHRSDGMYTVTFSTSDTGTLGDLTFIVRDDSLMLLYSEVFTVVPANVNDSFIAGSDYLQIDTVQISGDSTAADNIEATFDGTGYTDDVAPATQQQLGLLTSGSAAINTVSETAVVTTGTQTNTYTSTYAFDGTYHQIADATNSIDLYYQFDVGGDGVPVSAFFSGRLTGSNDSLGIYAYNWGGTSWEQIGTLSGTNSSSDSTETYNFTLSHVGTGANLGKVRLRFYAASGLTSATLYVDRLLCAYSVISSTLGFVNGAVWVDTVNGESGTSGTIGSISRPVDNIADAKTIADANNLRRFQFLPGSSATLASSYDAYEFLGFSYTIALGGQSVSGSLFSGAAITGNDDGSNTVATVYRNCLMSTNTLGLHKLDQCGLSATITLAETGTYDWTFCFSEVAGTSTPIVDVGSAVGSTNLNIRHYSGGIELQNLGQSGTDNVTVEGNGQVKLNANCTGGTVAIRGNFRLTDNSGSVAVVPTVPTINQVHTGQAQAGSANTITLSTSASSTDGTYDPGVITLVAGTGLGQSRLIIGYVGSTRVCHLDKDWRTTPDSTTSYVITPAYALPHVNEGLAQGGASTTITLNSSASATDDMYIGQTVFIVSGTGQDQARIVTDYVGSTKVATVHKAWVTNPDATSGYLMLPLPTIGDTVASSASAETIADAVWDEARSSHTTSGSFGEGVNVETLNTQAKADVNAEADTALSDYDAPTKAELDSGLAGLNDLSAAEVNAQVDTALADYDAPTKAELDTAIASVTSAITALNNISTADVNTQVDSALQDLLDLSSQVESYTVRQVLKLVLAALFGVTASDGTTIYDPSGSSVRAAVTMSSRDRSSVTLTPDA